MILTAVERETIVNFNELEDTASLYTYNDKLIKRFDKLAKSRPDLVSRKEDSSGAVTFTLPKKLLTITAREPASEESRNAAARRAKQNRPWEKSSVINNSLSQSIDTP